MLRHSRLVLLVLVAMFALAAAPSAMAQTPVTDQYTTDDTVPPPVDDGGEAPADDTVADDGGEAPAEAVTINVPVADTGNLPFTGGQISLIALIGLGLLALGTLGIAISRRRGSPTAAS